MNIFGTGYVLNNCMCTGFFRLLVKPLWKNFFYRLEKRRDFYSLSALSTRIYYIAEWCSSESWSPAPPTQVIRLPPVVVSFNSRRSFVRSFVRDIEKGDGYIRETICEENGHTFAVTSRGINQPPQHSVRVHQPAETVKQPKWQRHFSSAR